MDAQTLMALVAFTVAVVATVLIMGKLDKNNKAHHNH